MKDYHCCATCKNIKIEKKPTGITYHCSRLGYETKTYYKFNCWEPNGDRHRLRTVSASNGQNTDSTKRDS